jgi:hypothetical protein
LHTQRHLVSISEEMTLHHGLFFLSVWLSKACNVLFFSSFCSFLSSQRRFDSRKSIFLPSVLFVIEDKFCKLRSFFPT